jgi:hypothetical protein
MCKLQIFVITNMCKPIFVNFGRIGTWFSAPATAEAASWPSSSCSEFFSRFLAFFGDDCSGNAWPPEKEGKKELAGMGSAGAVASRPWDQCYHFFKFTKIFG